MAKKFDLSKFTDRSNAGIMDDPLMQNLLGSGDKTMTGQQAEPQTVPLADCHPWHDAENAQQPFHIYSQEKLNELAADLAARGLDNPIIVRPFEDGYQILSGHNRVEAAKIAGWTTIPAKIVSVDDDAARLIMVNTNLLQRDKILPSEKARAYKIQLDAMKRQAGRPSKENVSQIETQKRSDQILAEQLGENRNQIQRYIRLNALIPSLLDMVDTEQLPFTVGVSLSYLSKPKQQLLLDIMSQHEVQTINGKQADFFKSKGDELTEATIRQILGIIETSSGPRPKPQKSPFSSDFLRSVWPEHLPFRLSKDEELVRRLIHDEAISKRVTAIIDEYASERI